MVTIERLEFEFLDNVEERTTCLENEYSHVDGSELYTPLDDIDEIKNFEEVEEIDEAEKVRKEMMAKLVIRENQLKLARQDNK